MPHKIVGRTVYVKKGGGWAKRATAKSEESAKRIINLLSGAEYNSWKSTRKKKKKKKKY